MTPARRRPPADCPVCGVAVTITRVTCEACGTELTGRFFPCGLCGLSDGDVALVITLLTAGGDLDEVARLTGLGLDALQGRLRAAAEHLGHQSAASPPAGALAGEPPDGDGNGNRDDFLERLALGVVEADEALRRLP